MTEDVEPEPEPEISSEEAMKMFEELISEIGEGDVRVLLCNTIGKLRWVGEDTALDMFKDVLSAGIISCYGIENNGWKVEGLGYDEVTKRLIYDKPVFFVSMLAPTPRDIFIKSVREKLIKAKIAEKFKGAIVSEGAPTEPDGEYPRTLSTIASKLIMPLAFRGIIPRNTSGITCWSCGFKGEPSEFPEDVEGQSQNNPLGLAKRFVLGQFYSCPRCNAEVEKK